MLNRVSAGGITELMLVRSNMRVPLEQESLFDMHKELLCLDLSPHRYTVQWTRRTPEWMPSHDRH